MHPAYSVIFFTTASGAGYGLLALLGIFAAAGLLPASPLFGFFGMGLALALITAGLLSSTFHLGRPERAMRAFTQWRTSWLSREGVAAVLCYVPAAVLGIGWVFMSRTDGIFAASGIAAAILATVTVFTTSMIYASLKPIPQWNVSLVPPAYLTLGAMTGALLLVALTQIFGIAKPVFGWLAVALIVLAWLVKTGYWAEINFDRPRYDMGEATGLGHLGKVRMFESPHTEANYLMREMGFQVARKHAMKLRLIVHLLLFAVPLVLTVLFASSSGILAALASLVAVASAAAGVFAERWLFFAEARHTSMLYYGQEM
ncbi:MAG: dimethyl sulfoxide reductase anchor subunit family protein [Beijerinckiaceae bacterium]